MAKVQDILKFGPKDRANTQLSVDEARAAMVAAGEAPGSTKIKLANDARRKTFTDAQAAGLPLAEARRLAAEAAENVVAAGVVTAPAATSPAPAQQRPTPEAARRFVQPAQTTPAPAERAERIETKKFVGVIKQEGGLWVAEITYKSGAGTERFTATTKNQLMLKLLEGKANGTLKVRDVTRAAKLGEPEFDHAYSFVGIPQAEYDAMSDAAKSALVDAEAAKATIQFKEDYPEFLPTALNSQKITGFLDARRAVFTYSNLVKAFEALTATEELELRPENELPTVLEDSAPAGDSAAVAVTQPAVSTAPAVSASEPQVRKRGTTGIMPGFSSAGEDTELETSEEGDEQRQPSRAELMTLSLDEHRKLYKKTLKQPNRSF
jgi:hypothetical protein